jgi:phosphonate transport system substrate-binding protein
VPSPNAIGASLLIRADLEHLHGVRMKMVNVKTHSSVYLNVLNGLTEAGGGVEKTFAEQDAPVRDALRVIYTTREMSSHPVAAHSRIDQAAREQVRRGLLALAATPAGKALLDEVPMKEPVTASVTTTWSCANGDLRRTGRRGKSQMPLRLKLLLPLVVACLLARPTSTWSGRRVPSKARSSNT